MTKVIETIEGNDATQSDKEVVSNPASETEGENAADSTETYQTLETRFTFIKSMINKCIKLLRKDPESLSTAELEKIFHLLNGTSEAYNHFIELIAEKKFDILEDVKTFRFLLVHDLRKPGAVVTSAAWLGKISDTEQKRELLKQVHVTEQLERMVGAVSIMSSINDARRVEMEPRLSLKAIQTLLGLKKVNSNYILKKTGLKPTDDPDIKLEVINTTGDYFLTIEEFFTLDTLLINLTNETTCNKGKVVITEDGDYRYISVYDNVGTQWPENVRTTAPIHYGNGYETPVTNLDNEKGGLRMVLNLAGQRHKQSGLWASATFVKFKDASGKDDMKSVTFVFPKQSNNQKVTAEA